MTYYRDIDMSLDISQEGDIKDNEDIDAIENSIKNISRTLQNSRRMLPSFAFNAHELLFEPLSADISNQLANNIGDSIEKGDSRVKMEGIHVKIDYENSAYIATIQYSINNITRESTTVDVILEQL